MPQPHLAALIGVPCLPVACHTEDGRKMPGASCPTQEVISWEYVSPIRNLQDKWKWKKELYGGMSKNFLAIRPEEMTVAQFP